jgi:hypothetical protein
MMSFAGRWFTTFGPMILEQVGSRVSGTYGDGFAISGNVQDRRLVFAYEEAAQKGTGWFELLRYGHFAGEYLADGEAQSHTWKGNREFDGLWESTFGRLRLIQDVDHVRGRYGAAAIEGSLEGGRLSFSYSEVGGNGSGWFELDDDVAGFHGEWQTNDESARGEWSARRVLPAPGSRWLVVLEAQWQHSLADSEYSFGAMLSAFFAPVASVWVRHRYFQDEAGLLHWCRELQSLAEPVVLVIASHGVAEGVRVQGTTVDTQRIVEELRPVDNLELVHFSCCLVGKDERRALVESQFPASGYATSVNWAQSAMIEFIYLDLILRRGLSPERAADRLVRLVRFAGEDADDADSPYPGAGFRFFGGRGAES